MILYFYFILYFYKELLGLALALFCSMFSMFSRVSFLSYLHAVYTCWFKSVDPAQDSASYQNTNAVDKRAATENRHFPKSLRTGN